MVFHINQVFCLYDRTSIKLTLSIVKPFSWELRITQSHARKLNLIQTKIVFKRAEITLLKVTLEKIIY